MGDGPDSAQGNRPASAFTNHARILPWPLEERVREETIPGLPGKQGFTFPLPVRKFFPELNSKPLCLWEAQVEPVPPTMGWKFLQEVKSLVLIMTCVDQVFLQGA